MDKEYEKNYDELLKVIAKSHPDTLLNIIKFAKWINNEQLTEEIQNEL
tara:strand:+ start:971 stop:1114 length:144 start_codon:yes stop_codon:yes gene_type:complete